MNGKIKIGISEVLEDRVIGWSETPNHPEQFDRHFVDRAFACKFPVGKIPEPISIQIAKSEVRLHPFKEMNSPDMTPALTIIDHLLPDDRALEIRNTAIAVGFKDLNYMSGVYQGTCVDYRPPDMQGALEAFMGRPIKIHMQAFRNGHKDTTLHVNIHADNVITQWAAVYYLNLPDQCHGGTAFWSMKETGWDKMPTQEIMDASGHDLEWVKDQWSKPEAWQLDSIAGMKFNRLIFYPTFYFHSRYPLQGWGEGAEDGRLVWVCFFDVIPPETE